MCVFLSVCVCLSVWPSVCVPDCLSVGVCLGMREARPFATGATPAQTGIGTLHDSSPSGRKTYLTGSLSGWLIGCLGNRTNKGRRNIFFSYLCL